MNRETFITETTQRIEAELAAQLAAGDRDVALLVDEGFGARLFSTEDNVQFHIDMANGIDRYGELKRRILADEAEVRALKLAEQAEKQRAADNAEYRYEMARAERAAA